MHFKSLHFHFISFSSRRQPSANFAKDY